MILKARRTLRNEAGLTKREQAKQDTMTRVRDLKEQGYKQKEIADLLGVSVDTVKNDRKSIK